MSFTWDAENRLASVTLPGAGGTVSYQYDPFGRRVEKVSPSGTTIYAYDGDNVVEKLGGGCRKRHILRYLAHRIKLCRCRRTEHFYFSR